MMRFPLRLTAKLAKALVARRFGGARSVPLIEFVNPAEALHPGSAQPVSHEKIQAIIDSPAPVVWVGGDEPLDHAGVAHFVRAIAQRGRFLFLETRGALLRRRIHEFQPLPQLFLTVRLDIFRTPAFDLAVEGLRAAYLSGFCTAVHSLVAEDSDLAQLLPLRDFLSALGVDGWLITASAVAAPAVRKAAEARNFIPSRLWRQFSVRVERQFLSQAPAEKSPSDAAAPDPLADSCEHGVKVA